MMRLEGEVPVAEGMRSYVSTLARTPLSRRYWEWRNMTGFARQAISNPLGYHANFDGDA